MVVSRHTALNCIEGGKGGIGGWEREKKIVDRNRGEETNPVSLRREGDPGQMAVLVFTRVWIKRRSRPLGGSGSDG